MTLTTEARSHVSTDSLYLYRDAEDAWGHPDVLTFVDGDDPAFLSRENADAIAQVMEDANSVPGLISLIEELLQRPSNQDGRWVRPPTVYECMDHLRAGGTVEEQTKGWRHSGNGGQWVEATFNLADYEEWVRKDVPRGFLRLVPLPEA